MIRKPKKRIFGNQAQRRNQAVIQNPTALVLHGHYICQERCCPSPIPPPHPTYCHSVQLPPPHSVPRDVIGPAPSHHPAQPTMMQYPASISQERCCPSPIPTPDPTYCDSVPSCHHPGTLLPQPHTTTPPNLLCIWLLNRCFLVAESQNVGF